jgi:uncharacterized protein YnzC (UPF0291/DUF896 family)
MTVNRAPTADELNGVYQDTTHYPAKARRVTLVDTEGNEITNDNGFLQVIQYHSYLLKEILNEIKIINNHLEEITGDKLGG